MQPISCSYIASYFTSERKLNQLNLGAQAVRKTYTAVKFKQQALCAPSFQVMEVIMARLILWTIRAKLASISVHYVGEKIQS